MARPRGEDARVLGFVTRGQARHGSAADALRRYRARGGKVRTQNFYALWRQKRDSPSLPAVKRHRRVVDKPGGYLYNLRLYTVDRDGRSQMYRWVIKTDRPISDRAAVASAIAGSAASRAKYGLTVVAGEVSSIEDLVAAGPEGQT